MSFGAAGGLGAQQFFNPNTQDVEVVNPPGDSVQALCFSPTPNPNILITGSWDNVVRAWEISPNGTTRHVADQQHQGPVLDVKFHNDGSKVFSGSCDKTVQMWDLGANRMQQVGVHDAPVKGVEWVAALGVLMTGSWDKRVRYWDLRQPAPALEVPQKERVYCMAHTGDLGVVCTADRWITIYDLRKPNQPYREFQSLLKYQTRCVATFPDLPKRSNLPTEGKGFAYGSIEGRVALHFVEEPLDAKTHFSFKCHRDPQTTAQQKQRVYPVNSISFHPLYGTFATAGSDGTYHFWDKDSKQRLKAFPANATQNLTPPKWSDGTVAPITAASFNADGSIYAYAFSYDWSKGYSVYDPNIHKPHIFLHACNDQETKPRPRN